MHVKWVLDTKWFSDDGHAEGKRMSGVYPSRASFARKCGRVFPSAFLISSCIRYAAVWLWASGWAAPAAWFFCDMRSGFSGLLPTDFDAGPVCEFPAFNKAVGGGDDIGQWILASGGDWVAGSGVSCYFTSDSLAFCLCWRVVERLFDCIRLYFDLFYLEAC